MGPFFRVTSRESPAHHVGRSDAEAFRVLYVASSSGCNEPTWRRPGLSTLLGSTEDSASWGTRIRTLIARVRVLRPAIRRSPKGTSQKKQKSTSQKKQKSTSQKNRNQRLKKTEINVSKKQRNVQKKKTIRVLGECPRERETLPRKAFSSSGSSSGRVVLSEVTWGIVHADAHPPSQRAAVRDRLSCLLTAALRGCPGRSFVRDRRRCRLQAAASTTGYRRTSCSSSSCPTRRCSFCEASGWWRSRPRLGAGGRCPS